MCHSAHSLDQNASKINKLSATLKYYYLNILEDNQFLASGQAKVVDLALAFRRVVSISIFSFLLHSIYEPGQLGNSVQSRVAPKSQPRHRIRRAASPRRCQSRNRSPVASTRLASRHMEHSPDTPMSPSAPRPWYRSTNRMSTNNIELHEPTSSTSHGPTSESRLNLLSRAFTNWVVVSWDR
uniref:Uncharacterized protein n=1 Tax=Kalanchoe fedtschenkoi TaxID=63787 RepID=A0A7N0ZTS1_KALFE